VGEDLSYRLLSTTAKGDAGVQRGHIGGGPRLELPQLTEIDRSGKGLIEKFRQLIVKVGNGVSEKDKLRCTISKTKFARWFV
jgi:hypothetical protein